MTGSSRRGRETPPARDVRLTRAHSRARGSISAFVVLLVACLAALLGLVAEGGQVLATQQQAAAEAEQAARTGAAELSAPELHAGAIIDGDGQPVRAAEYVMVADGHPGTAWQRGDRVMTRITPFEVRTPLLALVGIPSIRVSASASAVALSQ